MLADEEDVGGVRVAGKSDVVHCFFSCSTVDEEEDGGTCLAVVVRLEPSGLKECASRGQYDMNSEKDSTSAARLPMVLWPVQCGNGVGIPSLDRSSGRYTRERRGGGDAKKSNELRAG